MFTGLIETVGVVKLIDSSDSGKRIKIYAPFFNDNTLRIGDSISVNGACHTVISAEGDLFEVETMNETLRRTNLKNLKTGSRVNLERAMKSDGRFGGHIVSGHIDGISKLISKKKDGFSFVYRFEYPAKYIAEKGSICVNGVSLTVSGFGADYFEVSLIPHTLANTNLNELEIGNEVNIEVDILAKYVEKFVHPNDNKSKIDENFLRENGFLDV